jgi:hypothetical protein
MDEVIRLLNEHNVRYLLIGGQAVRLEGMPRFSMDWDFLIPPRDLENVARINAALSSYLDVPLVPLGPRGESFVQTYQTPCGIIQFHLGAVGIADFSEVETRAVVHKTESGTPVRCLHGADILASKERAGRPQDQADIAFLRRKKDLGKL